SPAPGLHQLDDLVAAARHAGIEVTVETTGVAYELPSALDTAAYRVLQESITNVIRHAGRGCMRIGVHYGEGELVLSVADDGQAAAPARTDGGGRGIAGMRERCELLGGRLTAGPGPGGGFTVQAVLPVRPALVAAA